MSRLTTACCMECNELGVIPETDEELLSDEEVESTISRVGESIQPKSSQELPSESLWRKGIKWVVFKIAGLNHRINYVFNEPCRMEGARISKSTSGR